MKYPGHILIQRFQPEAGEMAQWVEHPPTSTGSRVWTPRTQGELHLGGHTPALLQWAGNGSRDRRTGSSWAREHGVGTRDYLKQGGRKRPTLNISSDRYIKASLAHGRHAHTKMSNPVTIEITYQ